MPKFIMSFEMKLKAKLILVRDRNPRKEKKKTSEGMNTYMWVQSH